MTKHTEVMKLAQELRALADRFSEGWHEGIKIDASDIVLLSDAAEALAEQPAQPKGCLCPACKVTPHASDCAVHNEPAYQKGSCDCGAQQWNAGVPSLYPEPEPGVSIKATYEQPAQQQEPVAWMTPTGALYRTGDVDGCFDDTHIPLYTSPQPAQPSKPLTDEEIESINVKFAGSRDLARLFARAIEAVHGIKGDA